MAKSYPIDLAAHVPVEAVEPLIKLLHAHRIRLTIKSDRITKLGDFRPAINGSHARISVNGGLNLYEFLLVFLHELAHLFMHEKHGKKASPHGKEWKQEYGQLIRYFIEEGIFHQSLHDVLGKYSYKVRAAGIGDMELSKALRRFDNSSEEPSWYFLEEIPQHAVFKTSSGRLFRKEDRVRRRYSCVSVDNSRKYLIHPLARVWVAENN